MKKILILGGYGLAGRLLARHLLEQSEALIVLAGRHLEKAKVYAEQLNSEFEGGRVSFLRVDAVSLFKDIGQMGVRISSVTV